MMIRVSAVYNYIYEKRWPFIRYGVVGSAGALLDVFLLFLAVEVLEYPPSISVAVTQIALIVYGFLFHKYWSFRRPANTKKQSVRYLLLVMANYLFSIGAMAFGAELLRFPAVFVRIGSIFLMASWNFLLYTHWVYRHEDPPLPSG